MSKPFDYSKWDKIELSDDEDDVHPNIDRESWFRMKHRSRVEREDNEDKDKAKIRADMEAATRRIQILEHDLQKLAGNDDSDDDSDDDLEKEAWENELKSLRKENEEREAKLAAYEKNKTWNIDNMFEVKEERTLVNKKAAEPSYTDSGFVVDKVIEEEKKSSKEPATSAPVKPAPSVDKAKVSTEKAATKETGKSMPATDAPQPSKPTTGPNQELGAMETYHEFTERHADLVEEFMKCKTLEDSRKFLLEHGNTLLQENASNYLLLASLEDEMNGHREKMKLTARQSQIITNIAELAKTLKTHPGNVIQPFFQRMTEREHLEEFLTGVKIFTDKIIKRAIVKKAEIDEERRAQEEASDLHEIPLEERLGPGGLDPLEVIETLPESLRDAFASRDVDQLKEALSQLDPADAEYHMKRCVDSGLWVAGG